MDLFPIDQSSKLTQAVQVYNLLNSKTAVMYNPLTNPGQSYGLASTQVQQTLQGTIGSFAVDHPATFLLSKVSSVIGDSSAQVLNLMSHTNALIFGNPGNASVISGGLQSNLGLAMAAISLDNTLGAANSGHTPASANGNRCQLIQDLFGSILGAGNDLINQLSNALSNLPIRQLLDTVGKLVNAGADAITAALAAIGTVLQTALAAMAAITKQITDLIQKELSQFADWLAKQLNFNLASFLSGLFDNPCFQTVAKAVGTGALLGVLSATPAAAAPLAAAGALWSRRT